MSCLNELRQQTQKKCIVKMLLSRKSISGRSKLSSFTFMVKEKVLICAPIPGLWWKVKLNVYILDNKYVNDNHLSIIKQYNYMRAWTFSKQAMTENDLFSWPLSSYEVYWHSWKRWYFCKSPYFAILSLSRQLYSG